jgi:predicted permease
MKVLRRLVAQLTGLITRHRDEHRLREEIEQHLEQQTAANIRAGMSCEEARRHAVLKFGAVEAVKEAYREQQTLPVLEFVLQDVRYAIRGLLRAPGFMLVAVLTLAIGIGANTSIFSVINAVILRPLPYRDSSRLVLIVMDPLSLAPSWLTAVWRERVRTLSDFAGFNGPRPATLVRSGAPQQIDSADVTWNFLSLLGVTPIHGRDFVAKDADPGTTAVGIISHELWQGAFGADPAVLGETVTVTGTALTIIGITPAEFRFPTAGALPTWGLINDTQPDVLRVAGPNIGVNVIGRLAPDRLSASASNELLGILKQAAGTRFRAEAVDRFELQVVPLQEMLIGNVQRRLWLVMGSAGFVLLIACANVANLLLARATARRRELALRMAIGARRGQIARLLLAESLVLATLGWAGGLLIALVTGRIALTLLAHRLPHINAISLDTVVLFFNITIAAATGIICGLVSLSGVTGVNVAASVERGTPTVTGQSWIRRLLLSAESGVTFVLVVGAALFAQTLWNLTNHDRGFDADRLLTMRVAAGLPTNPNRNDRRAGSKYFVTFFEDLQNRLHRIPGVISAAAVSLGPLEGAGAGFGNIAVNGRSNAAESFTPVAFVTPGYLQTLRIPLVSGRDFDVRDRAGTKLVAVVNEAFQRRFAPEADILGSRITSGSGSEAFTIVGVAKDTPDRSLRETPAPLLMVPLAQMPDVHISWGAFTFVLRTNDRDPLRLAPEVRRTIWATNPNIVITEMISMDSRVAAGLRTERDTALLFGMFAVMALLMAAIGVYGVAAYMTAQRTREIGVRIALGAGVADVRRLVISQTLWPTLSGIAAGAICAAMLTQFVVSMLYGVAPVNLAAFAVATVVLVSVAMFATWMPARRAARVDPLVALRYE